MKTETINGGTYKVSESGTYYHIETKDAVINALEKARANRTRVRLFWGDVETGKCWNDIYDITGTIGRSTGTVKIPLLIHNSRSMGGGGILTHCILKIKETGKNGRTLYQSDNFIAPVAEIVESDLKSEGYAYNVLINGELQTRHKTLKQAENMALRFTF